MEFEQLHRAVRFGFRGSGLSIAVESIVGDSVMRVYGISGGRHRIMASDVKASSPISSPDCLKFHSPSFKHYLFQATRQSHNRDESETSFCVHWTYTGDPKPNIQKPTMGASIIRIGFWGPVYYNYDKEPSK